MKLRGENTDAPLTDLPKALLFPLSYNAACYLSREPRKRRDSTSLGSKVQEFHKAGQALWMDRQCAYKLTMSIRC